MGITSIKVVMVISAFVPALEGAESRAIPPSPSRRRQGFAGIEKE